LRRKEPKPSAFKDVESNPEFIEGKIELPEAERKTSFYFLTREEKMQEASKPLYLKRYE
jgi:hypothetical protein